MTRQQQRALQEPNVFRTTFRAAEHEIFEVVCYPQGAGFFSDGHERIGFSFDPAHYQHPGALEECSNEIFWEEINPQLSDPVIHPEDLEGEEFHYETGGEEQLKEDVRMILWCFPELFAARRRVCEGACGAGV